MYNYLITVQKNNHELAMAKLKYHYSDKIIKINNLKTRIIKNKIKLLKLQNSMTDYSDSDSIEISDNSDNSD